MPKGSRVFFGRPDLIRLPNAAEVALLSARWKPQGFGEQCRAGEKQLAAKRRRSIEITVINKEPMEKLLDGWNQRVRSQIANLLPGDRVSIGRPYVRSLSTAEVAALGTGEPWGAREKQLATKGGRPIEMALIDGERVKKLLEGRNQKVIARLCKISVDTLQRAARGRATAKTVKSIANYFKIKEESLKIK